MSTIDLRSVARAAVRNAEGAALSSSSTAAPPNLETAEALWDAASGFLEHLDAYDRLIRHYRPTPDSLAQEARLRDSIRAARQLLRQIIEEFDAEAEQLTVTSDPAVAGARSLRNAISEYLDAEDRRAETNLQFQQLAGPLDDLERAHAAAASAEGRLRQAANAYEMIR